MKILVLGSGQLARMMSLESTHLDIQIIAYDVNTKHVINPVTLDVSNESLEQAVISSDAITAEFEHIPVDVLTLCCDSGKFYPGKEAILAGGDRSIEKHLLSKTGVQCAPYKIITQKSHFLEAINNLGLPLVIKTCQAGYDGKGQWRLNSSKDSELIWSEMSEFLNAGTDQLSHSIVAEKMIPFDREVSIIGVRNKQGKCRIYPLTENQHTNGVLTLSIAGLDNSNLQSQAEAAFSLIANELNYVGTLAIEFFDVQGDLLVNEIAPRVHNSGHWTQQGTHTSQFENHIRAVADLPLGCTELQTPTAMINVLGQTHIPKAVLDIQNTTSHWYGKSTKPGRKMGHINVSAKTLHTLGERLAELSDVLPDDDYPGVLDTAKNLILN